MCIYVYTRLSILPYTAKMFEGENFRSFHGFSLNRKCFPMNYGLVNWQCKSTSMLVRKFSCEWQFCTLSTKVFPLESFAVYGITHYQCACVYIHVYVCTCMYVCMCMHVHTHFIHAHVIDVCSYSKL